VDKLIEKSMSILIAEDLIQSRVKELVEEISIHYGNQSYTIISILSGSVYFSRDLNEEWPHQLVTIGTIGVSSYDGTNQKQLQLTQNLSVPVKDRHVLIVDDILDSGRTLAFVKKHILNRQACSVKTCVLLRKITSSMSADFIGFDNIPDDFVVGYGMDYKGLFRDYPHIGVLNNAIH